MRNIIRTQTFTDGSNYTMSESEHSDQWFVTFSHPNGHGHEMRFRFYEDASAFYDSFTLCRYQELQGEL